MINAIYFSRHFDCYGSEEIRDGRKLRGILYWMCDKMDESTWKAIQEKFPHAEKYASIPEYAREMIRTVVFIPSAAELKRRAVSGVAACW